MSNVAVSPTILKWAVNRSGKGDRVHFYFPNWNKWISQERQPTVKQLERLSTFTATPLGFFFLAEPPVERLPVPHYRTIEDAFTSPSPELLESIQTMERRQQWMREYLTTNGHEPLDFVGRFNTQHDVFAVAEDIRKVLKLKNGWAATCRTWEAAYRMLLQRVEDIGVLVNVNGVVGNNTHRKLNVTEFRGFVLVDEFAPLIFVNGADAKAAQMFTLAHELAHIWYGASAIFDLQNLHPADGGIERLCNVVAAEFLVPREEIVNFWHQVRDVADKFQLLARHFKVSEIVAARRALDLALVTKAEFFEYYEERREVDFQGRGASSGGDFYANQSFRIGRRFAEAVIRATAEGKLLYSEAYRLTGLRSKTFSTYAASLGFGGDV